MTSRFSHRLVIVVLSVACPLPFATAQSDGQQTFASEKEALSAFVEAVRADNPAQVQAILGADAQQITSSGDSVADKHARDNFLQKYET